MPPTPRSRLRSLLRELPLLVGLLLALLRCPWPIAGEPLRPAGSDWPQYLLAAFSLGHPDQALPWPDWRKPLYPWLLSALSDAEGYLEAARGIGLFSALLIVAAAAIAGRALAGPWAGGAAALIAVALPSLIGGAHWVNPYALLAACTGLALAFGLAAARWRRPELALFAGLFAGLAWAMDTRGLLAVGSVLVMVLGSLCLRQRLRAGLSAGLLLLGLGLGGPLVSAQLAVPQLQPFGEQLRIQRATILREIRDQGFSPGLMEACAEHEGAERAWSPVGACGRALLGENLQRMRRQGQLPLPPALLALLTVVALGASRRRWELAAGVGLFVLPVGAFLLGASWVVYHDRYLLQLAVPLACLPPAALLLLGQRLEGRYPAAQRWLRPAIVALALLTIPIAWLAPAAMAPPRAGPPLGAGPAPAGTAALPLTVDQELGAMAAWLQETMAPGERFYDCSQQGIETLWLPEVAHPGVVSSPADCERLLGPVAGGSTTWMFLRSDSAAHAAAPRAGWRPVPCPYAPRWVQDGALWRRGGEP